MNQPRTPDGRFAFGRGGAPLGSLEEGFTAPATWEDLVDRSQGYSDDNVVLDAADVYTSPGVIQGVEVTRLNDGRLNIALSADPVQMGVASREQAARMGLTTLTDDFEDTWPDAVVHERAYGPDLPAALEQARAGLETARVRAATNPYQVTPAEKDTLTGLRDLFDTHPDLEAVDLTDGVQVAFAHGDYVDAERTNLVLPPIDPAYAHRRFGYPVTRAEVKDGLAQLGVEP